MTIEFFLYLVNRVSNGETERKLSREHKFNIAVDSLRRETRNIRRSYAHRETQHSPARVTVCHLRPFNPLNGSLCDI